MDQATKLDRYRAALKQVLQTHAAMEAEPKNYETVAVCDSKTDDYRLIDTEITPEKRQDYLVVQLTLREGKVWVEQDGIEYGIAQDLLEAGIPAEDIVIGISHGRPLTLAEAA